MAKMDFKGPGGGTAAGGRGPIDTRPAGTVRCTTCMDAGFVRRDVPCGHADFGKAIPCPKCGGAARVRDARDEAAVVRYTIARDHAEMAGLPEPPPPRFEAGAPPDGFARGGVPVPTTVAEEQRERSRQLIAKGIAKIAGRMREPVR